MENDYLHKISIKKISEDTGLSAEEVAKLAGIKTAKNLGKWAQSKPDGARPNYNAFVRLFQAGATVETLFGVDYKPKQTAPAVPSPDSREPINFDDPKFQAAVKAALAEMKQNGQL